MRGTRHGFSEGIRRHADAPSFPLCRPRAWLHCMHALGLKVVWKSGRGASEERSEAVGAGSVNSGGRRDAREEGEKGGREEGEKCGGGLTGRVWVRAAA